MNILLAIIILKREKVVESLMRIHIDLTYKFLIFTTGRPEESIYVFDIRNLMWKLSHCPSVCYFCLAFPFY